MSYTASALDDHDGTLSPTCTPPSGSTFPIAKTTVNCSATDSKGLTGTGAFDVVVADTTAPVLVLPHDQTVEATGPSGAPVTFETSASDAVDGATSVMCDRQSGDSFPLGTTPVTCSTSDAHGNSTQATFEVLVQDTTPPALNMPHDMTIEATGPGGAPASFTPTATDLVDGAMTPTCSAGSGSTFAIGQTGVKCTVTDQAGNSVTGSFIVNVVDTTAPTLHLPADVNATPAGSAGTPVSWSASASDIVDGSTSVTCDHPSGSSFSVGTTTVTCTSTDTRGNTATASFKVNVAYGWNGFSQPINDTGHDQTTYSVFKAGSTIPVKFSLYDASGKTVRATGTPVWVQPQQGAVTSQPLDEDAYTLPATTCTTFTYDGASQYQYNWATSKSMAGSYWRIGVRLDDGTTKYVVVALR